MEAIEAALDLFRGIYAFLMVWAGKPVLRQTGIP